MILAGVLLKMGTYGLIRVAVGVAPEGARWAAPVLGVLAVAAILVGGAGLPGADRAEAAHRVLQRRAHGLRAARASPR